jgi:prepilin-type N-terminal cleavage/methylation domain-containing protein
MYYKKASIATNYKKASITINYKKENIATTNSNRGYTLIELALVMALLTLFGIATLSLVLSSSDAYKGIIEKNNSGSELRVAISYLETKINHNDAENAIRLKKNPSGQGNAIVIEEVVEGSAYETWIFLSKGKLIEVLVNKGEAVRDDFGFEIANIDGFNTNYDTDRKLMYIDAWIDNQKGRQELDTIVAIRAGANNSEIVD